MHARQTSPASALQPPVVCARHESATCTRLMCKSQPCRWRQSCQSRVARPGDPWSTGLRDGRTHEHQLCPGGGVPAASGKSRPGHLAVNLHIRVSPLMFWTLAGAGGGGADGAVRAAAGRPARQPGRVARRRRVPARLPPGHVCRKHFRARPHASRCDVLMTPCFCAVWPCMCAASSGCGALVTACPADNRALGIVSAPADKFLYLKSCTTSQSTGCGRRADRERDGAGAAGGLHGGQPHWRQAAALPERGPFTWCASPYPNPTPQVRHTALAYYPASSLL